MPRVAWWCVLLIGCAHSKIETSPHHGEHGATEPIALPYHLVDGHTGAALDDEALDQRLRAARVIYVGEEHPNPHHHAVEIAVLQRVYQIDPSVALGLEMLPKNLQTPLDDFVAGRLTEEKLLDEVDWQKTWGYPWGFYAPLVRFCHEHALQAVGLNAPRALVHDVAHLGLERLPPEEKQQLPEISPGPEAHRELVREAFGAHPHGKFSQEQFDRFYAAQLVWDETMATRVAETMSAPNAPHRMVVAAGDGHVRHFAIPDRAARRGAAPYLVIVPLFEDEVAEAQREGAADVLWALSTRRASDGDVTDSPAR
jgi:uncharacterized iron-regulated protein